MPPASRILCCVAALALSGCYESMHPLGPSSRGTIDKTLVGNWDCQPPRGEQSEDRATLQVQPFDPRQYYIEWKEKEKSTRYRAYGSPIGPTVVLNVQELRTNKWVFARYQIGSDGRLSIAVVVDDALKGLSELEALRAIKARVMDDTLYKGFAVCTPNPPPSPSTGAPTGEQSSPAPDKPNP